MAMDSVQSRTSDRIELRVVQSTPTALDSWMTISNEAHVLSFPVHTQLGMPIKAIVGHDTVSLREGKLFIHDGGRTSAKVSKKPSYGLVLYNANVDVDMEAREQFHVRLYIPTERYNEIWDLAARGHLPQLITLQVKGLEGDAEWNVTDSSSLLLIEEFSFSFPIGS